MRIIFVGNHSVDFSSESHHAKSLEALGHEVVRLQETQATGEQILDEALKSDMLVHVHTHGWDTPGLPLVEVLRKLKAVGIPTVTYHLDLWFGLDRQKDLESDPFYKEIGYFFTVDKYMADWFNDNTEVKGHYLRAGVFGDETVMIQSAPKTAHKPELLSHDTPIFLNDVVFVGNRGYHHEWEYRPTIVDWLKNTYGQNFAHYGGDGIKVMRGWELNLLYGTTKVAVGDSLCLNFSYPYYWSDRVYETMGRGGFLIMPYIIGLEEEFVLDTYTENLDEVELVVYNFGDFATLRAKIDWCISHNEEREKIRENGFKKVRDNYTYKHRWESIINTVSKDKQTV